MPEQSKQPLCHTTPRLELLKSCIGCADVVADIGCDHAYLPILLVRAQVCRHVIASDIAKGPAAKAAENIARFGMNARISLRYGAGLSTLRAGEADVIVIAGMGGQMIADILHAHPEVAKSAKKIVVQPMTYSHRLRKYLYQNGYVIVNEDLAREGRRIYSAITAAAGETGHYSEADTYISPAVLKSGSPLTGGFVLKCLDEMNKILAGLKRGGGDQGMVTYYTQLISEIQSKYKSLV